MRRVTRICIYPKDVQTITGRSERQARRMLAEMRNILSKEEHQYITIKEFCQYTGLPIEEVIPMLTD